VNLHLKIRPCSSPAEHKGYNMAHFALPYLKKTRGCIVNIGSKTWIEL
jgi:hypothetical protein